VVRLSNHERSDDLWYLRMIAAIVPAKALDEAKSRLAALLSEDERRRLALAMLEDVLRTLRAVPRLDLVSVVSPDEDVLETARALGAEAIAEPPTCHGINQALEHALNVMSNRALAAVLVVLADVPALTPIDVDRVLDALPHDSGAVICPSSATGTSALALRPPDAIPFRFGAQSFAAHQREARERGVPMTVLHINSLIYDIDEPDDLRRLLARPAQTATYRLLTELQMIERMGARI